MFPRRSGGFPNTPARRWTLKTARPGLSACTIGVQIVHARFGEVEQSGSDWGAGRSQLVQLRAEPTDAEERCVGPVTGRGPDEQRRVHGGHVQVRDVCPVHRSGPTAVAEMCDVGVHLIERLRHGQRARIAEEAGGLG